MYFNIDRGKNIGDTYVARLVGNINVKKIYGSTVEVVTKKKKFVITNGKIFYIFI